MKRNLLLATIIVAVSHLSTLSAQVTIGANDSPAQGSLLDLKTKSDGTSSKGLLLPRVKLIKMADADISTTIDGVAANAYPGDHTGLVVYNVAPLSDDVCTGDLSFPGIYVWDGGKWNPLGRHGYGATGMNIITDSRDGETYITATFGAAGEWMIENLRYKDGLSISKSGDGDAVKSYFYPQPGAGSATDPNSITGYYKRQGLLYSWPAATNGENAITVEQGQVSGDTPGANEVENRGIYGTANKKYIKGICPDGWHLPSDREWNDLEEAIYNKSGDFSTIADNSFTPTSWSPTYEYGLISSAPGYGWRSNDNATGNGHGTAMKSACELPGTENGIPNGKSKSIMEGGFEALLTGYALNGKMGTHSAGTVGEYRDSAYFWTSSAATETDKAWRRTMVHDRIGVLRGEGYKFWLMSVRCKKND